MRYAVRRIRHRWAVCAGRLPLLQYDGFEEALDVARNAAFILSEGRAASQHEQTDHAAQANAERALPQTDSSIEIHQIDDRQIAVLR